MHWYILLLLALIVATALFWLFTWELHGGTPYVGPDGITKYYKVNALLPTLLGHDGLTLGPCNRYRKGHAPTPELAAHEWFHTTQDIGPVDAVHYATSAEYAQSLEVPAKAYGAANKTHPFWILLAQQIEKAVNS